MEQHPVPQNVTTFQFRLIGDMTIKQFGYLCGGAILAFICYKLPLPKLITLPAMGGFLFLGIGFAFIPIEERPMDVWVFSFFKSIYSPTQYVWIQSPPKPVEVSKNPFGHVFTMFTKKPQQIEPPTPVIAPPYVTGKRPEEPIQPEKKIEKQPEPSPDATQRISQLEESLKSLQSQLASKETTENRVVELQNQLTEIIKQKSTLESELIAMRRQIQTPAPQIPTEEPGKQRVNVITNSETAVRAGLPKLTNTPNVITGIIKDDTTNFLPGILVTITNTQNIPMRAFKTNKLGQFGATTPLPNGTYIIEIEDPRTRFAFDRVQITLEGKVVPALEILAKGQRQIVREKLAQEIFGKQPM